MLSFENDILPESPEGGTIQVLVPQRLVKTIKTALEEHGTFRKDLKIQPILDREGLERKFPEAYPLPSGPLYLVPTAQSRKFPHDGQFSSLSKSEKKGIATELGLVDYYLDISFWVTKSKGFTSGSEISAKPTKRSSLAKVIEEWLLDLPEEAISSLSASVSHLTSLSSWSYIIYHPLCLLPKNSFEHDPWPDLLANALAPHLPTLYAHICENWQVTHIALNASIPLNSSPSTASPTESPQLNILRSPTSLTPLYGSFGDPGQSPTSAAFEYALWVSTRQHSIYQTWAPLYTMFSRGNISEKHRILSMPELDPEVLGYDASQSSAVDLYAGIGYFTFCYARRGVGKVICFEINGWSVEGLRRGAKENGWDSLLVDDKESDVWVRAKEKLLVIAENNKNAEVWIRKMRDGIPPVRHVNCGFLPSSKESWETAVRVLDPADGGWIHVHENIGIKEIGERKEVIVKIFEAILKNAGRKKGRRVYCQHIERVKSYAPGVIHCVLDIHVTSVSTKTPTQCSSESPK